MSEMENETSEDLVAARKAQLGLEPLLRGG